MGKHKKTYIVESNPAQESERDQEETGVRKTSWK